MNSIGEQKWTTILYITALFCVAMKYKFKGKSRKFLVDKRSTGMNRKQGKQQYGKTAKAPVL
jgi:hypothetical protein